MEFVEAAHYTDTGAAGRTIDLLVIHDMEYPERLDAAEKVAQFFATTDREASAHYCLDADTTVRCVKDDDVAWAAPGANSDGLQFELAGYAAQRPDDWDDDYSRAMLKGQLVPLLARKCEKYKIPPVYLNAEALKQNRKGITTHQQVSIAFRLSTHTDPGVGFPIARIVGDVAERVDSAGFLARRAVPPTVEFGDSGWPVKKAQRHLKAHGFNPGPLDATFSKDTERAVSRFQRHVGLTPDGIVGPRTWHKLRG